MDTSTIARYNAYRKDPWLFLTECVFTRDAVDHDEPIKKFPEYEYLELFTRLWQREKMIAVPKSRRMTMSWTCIALYLWESIFHAGKETAFVSKKEDDAFELVNRAEFIYNHIPPEKIPKALLPPIRGKTMKKSPPLLEFDFGNGSISYIKGFPMGAEQLRQYTHSGIFGDESAFWPDAEKFYTGAKPTIDGGGKMTLVSSRAPSFFKKIVFDQINHKGLNFAEVAPGVVKRPMQGVEMWKNPTNKFVVMDLHYTAHPDKRNPEFRDQVKSSLPYHEYMREYEKSWETFSGMPVFPDFRKDIHIAKSKLEPHLGLPLLFGWDFGLTPACIVGQLQGSSLKIFREWISQNEGIKTFAPKVMSDAAIMWPQFADPRTNHYHFIDPAGFQKAQTDARTCAQEMMESGGVINLEPGPVAFTKRKDAVNHFLLKIDRAGAGLEVDEAWAPTLVAGLVGGYRYPDNMTEVESVRPAPIKDKYSHPCDAFEYLCAGARSKQHTSVIGDIPRPQYNFNHSKGALRHGS